jgi:AcrR family transcriptional regulator
MSLYRHFAGKDELVAEALAHWDPFQRALLLGMRREMPPRERLLGMFDRVADLADRLGGDFVGCPYVHARLELADDEHPAASAIAAHKDRMRRDLAALLGEIGVADPDKAALVVLMLLDGSIVHSVVQGNGGPLRAARASLPGLLDGLGTAADTSADR